MIEFDDEVFVSVNGYPDYSISNYGRVYNLLRNRELTWSQNQYGLFSVGLRNGDGYTRIPVKNLVARHFVEGQNDRFNSAVLKDCDNTNLHWSNIVWRPRWFSHVYARQFKGENARYPIINLNTQETFDSLFECAQYYCVLPRELWVKCFNGGTVFPVRYEFVWVINSEVYIKEREKLRL